ncbi:hypothetical protein [Maricaulis sp.]|uniref:hypothetical protein n=1 Tax=Maricaulis sp. TaxID=1486257 RepID=UPI003A910870
MRDLFTPAPPPEAGHEPSLGRKLLWFFGLCLAGSAAVAITAYALRSLLFL